MPQEHLYCSPGALIRSFFACSLPGTWTPGRASSVWMACTATLFLSRPIWGLLTAPNSARNIILHYVCNRQFIVPEYSKDHVVRLGIHWYLKQCCSTYRTCSIFLCSHSPKIFCRTRTEVAPYLFLVQQSNRIFSDPGKIHHCINSHLQQLLQNPYTLAQARCRWSLLKKFPSLKILVYCKTITKLIEVFELADAIVEIKGRKEIRPEEEPEIWYDKRKMIERRNKDSSKDVEGPKGSHPMIKSQVWIQ